MNSRVRLWIDGALLVAALLTIASGATLLLAFHVEGRWYRPEAFGWSRLAWQNLHRISSVAVLVSFAAHAAVNLRGIGARLRRTLRGAFVGQDRREFMFYVTFSAVVVTGFVIWLLVPGSLPLFGPARLAPIAHARHGWIDLHNLAGLIAIYLTMNHVIRRWNALRALLRHSRREGTAAWQTQSK